MLSHKGIPLRRIHPVHNNHFLIERIDRKTFVVSLDRIGTSTGTVDEVLRTARLHAGQILEDAE